MATKDKVQDVRPYVERALQDEELRDNLKAAFIAARDVYSDLMGDRGVSGLATRVAVIESAIASWAVSHAARSASSTLPSII